ncbi:MAG: DUF99 family protein [Nitrosopumilaceae archaeon]
MKHLHLEKKGLRGLAIAESFKQDRKKSNFAGIVMRRDFIVDGAVFGNATIEGDDATDVILHMHEKLHRDDISFVMISGLVISMYNIVDITRIYQRLKIPIIGVSYQESEGLDDAIKYHFPDSYKAKLEEYHKLGRREKITLHTSHDIFVRMEGCSLNETKRLLDAFTLQGAVPEPLRLAQMLAHAIL